MSLATAIYNVLTSVNVPKEQVREIVDTIENEMKNEFATKSDIALIRADLALVVSRVDKQEALSKVEFDSVRTEMRTEFAAVRTEMRTEIAALRTEMINGFAALRAEMAGNLALIRAEMKDLENRMIIKLGALMVILIGVLPKILSWLGW